MTQQESSRTTPSSALGPIKEVDAVVDQLRRVPGDRVQIQLLLRALARAIFSIYRVPAPPRPVDLAKALFATDLQLEVRRLIASALLRALADNPKLLEDQELRRDVFRLFDGALAHDLYSTLKIKEGDFAPEKEQRLRDAVARLDAQVETALNGFSSLAALSAIRPSGIPVYVPTPVPETLTRARSSSNIQSRKNWRIT